MRRIPRLSSEIKFGILLLVPAMTIILVVIGYPLLYSLYESFFQSNLTSTQSHFVGLKNYAVIFTSPFWWRALVTTIVIVVASMVCEIFIGFILALIIRFTPVLKYTIRTVILIPYGIVTAVSAYSWLYAWQPETGYLAHLTHPPSAILTTHIGALCAIVISEVWKTTPFLSLIFLSGLLTVQQDMLSSAELDGASKMQKLRFILLPAMIPSLSAGILLRTVDALRIFDNIYIMTRGNNTTYSLSMLGYDNLFKLFNIGLGSALSLMIFLCVTLIVLFLPKDKNSPFRVRRPD